MEHLQLCNQAISSKLVSRLFCQRRRGQKFIANELTFLFVLFQEKNFDFKIHVTKWSLWHFCFGGCKEAALSLIWHKFLFYAAKNFDYADADVSKLCRSVSPHPVRCPVKRGKDCISGNSNHNILPPNGCMRDWICASFWKFEWSWYIKHNFIEKMCTQCATKKSVW